MRNRPKPRSARHALEGKTPMRTGVSRGDYEAVHSDPAGGCRPSRFVERIPLVLEGVSGYEIDGSGTVWRIGGAHDGGHRRLRALTLNVALKVWAGNANGCHIEVVCPGVRRIRTAPSIATVPWDPTADFVSLYRTHRCEMAGSPSEVAEYVIMRPRDGDARERFLLSPLLLYLHLTDFRGSEHLLK